MSCKETIEHLNDYLDNELEVGECRRIKRHIDMCHECCEKVEFEQILKKIVRDKTEIHKTPQYLRERIINQWTGMSEENNPAEYTAVEAKGTYLKSIFGFFTLRPSYLTMAVILPLTIVSLVVYLAFFRPGESVSIVKVAAERHDSFVNNNMRLDLVSSDINEIKRHFSSQRSLPAIDVPECNGREMELLGCKNLNMFGKNSAYVGLRGNRDKISLEIVNGSDMDIDIDKLEHQYYKGRSYYFGRYKEYNVVLWKHGKMLYSLTSTMNREGLMRVASESLCSYNK